MGLLSFLFGNKTNKIKDYFDKDAVILDVRTLKEYETSHVKNALHIPVSELKLRLKEIQDLDKPIISYCASGIRSSQATQILKANGVDSINGGGISAVKKALKY